MKKQLWASLFTLICILGFGSGARAQEEGRVVANVPYDFIVGGQTLPAGTYRVGPIDSSTGSKELLISSYETRASAFIIPTFFDDVQTGDARLKLEHVGDKYFLTAVETPVGTYTLTIPRSAIELAQTEQKGGSPSGSN